MELMIEGELGVFFLKAARERFNTLCATFNAYDFFVIKQALYKLFTDNHASIGKLHRDGVMSYGGKIILDISGKGPQYSLKPGSVKFITEASRQKQIELAHSDKW